VIWIQNVAPSLSISGPSSAGMGSSYTLDLAASDPGVDTIAFWTINWGDGTTSTVDGSATSATKVFDAAGTFTITATATDEDGTYSANSRSVSVQAPPTAMAGGPYNVSEGGTVQLNAGGSTGSGLTYTWDLDGDGIYGETGSAAKRGDENGANPVFSAIGVNGTDSRTPRLRVTNSAGTSNASSVVWIADVAPTLSVSGPSSVDTGATFTLNLSASDPGPDLIASWTIDWGDGTSSSVTGNPTSVTKAYSAAGTYSITVSAIDNEGTHVAAPRSVQVTDALPADTAGNTTDTARNFGTLGAGVVKVAEDGVGSVDKNDFYRFTIDGPMTVNIKLSNLKDKADLFLLDSTGATIVASKRKGSSDEIIVKTLNAGTYYLRALYAGANAFTTYRLRLETIAYTLDPALATATEFGGLGAGAVKVATGSVSPGQPAAYYRFSLTSAAQMYFKLTELSDAADLQILDSTGTVVSTAKRMGTSDENLRVTLTAGTYYIKIVLKGSTGTTFRLRAANENT
jgi:hypothetical protein